METKLGQLKGYYTTLKIGNNFFLKLKNKSLAQTEIYYKDQTNKNQI